MHKCAEAERVVKTDLLIILCACARGAQKLHLEKFQAVLKEGLVIPIYKRQSQGKDPLMVSTLSRYYTLVSF